MLNIVIETKSKVIFSFIAITVWPMGLTDLKQSARTYYNPRSRHVSMTIYTYLLQYLDLTPSPWKCHISLQFFTDWFPPLFHVQQISQSPGRDSWSGGQLHWRVYQEVDGMAEFILAPSLKDAASHLFLGTELGIGGAWVSDSFRSVSLRALCRGYACMALTPVQSIKHPSAAKTISPTLNFSTKSKKEPALMRKGRD